MSTTKARTTGQMEGGDDTVAPVRAYVDPELQDLFAEVRNSHAALQGSFAGFIQSTVIPSCIDIGKRLTAIKARFGRGKDNDFIAAAAVYSGLKKSSVYNYLDIFNHGKELLAYLQALPAGQPKPVSLRQVLALVRDIKRRSLPDFDPTAPLPEAEPKKGKRKLATTAADQVREDAVPKLRALRAVVTLRPDQREALTIAIESVERVLAQLPTESGSPEPSGDRPADEWGEEIAEAVETTAVTVEASIPRHGGGGKRKGPDLRELFKQTSHGWEAIKEALEEHGSFRKAAEALGTTTTSLHRRHDELKAEFGTAEAGS